MDWGLAKVLLREGEVPKDEARLREDEAPAEPPTRGSPGSTGASPASPSQPAPSARLSKVVTSREPEADLTQEGAVLGTPLYVPPEQAAGRIQEIDQRSDVYVLEAILYEMLTLQPPVDKEGGYLAILMRVIEGEIVPPEQRVSPNRKRGIPRDLFAMAMKALARDRAQRAQRYQTVEEFRKASNAIRKGAR